MRIVINIQSTNPPTSYNVVLQIVGGSKKEKEE
ncbi:unnamed protein product, partial [marine sediment metagenome]